MNHLTIGMTGTQATTVPVEKTAWHLGSGGIEVLATPAMIALMEGAAADAIDQHPEAGQASVGVEISVKHLARDFIQALFDMIHVRCPIHKLHGDVTH